MSEIDYVPTNEQKEDQKEDNIIELRNQMETILDEEFPISQVLAEIRHRKEKLKLRIQNANTRYFEGKGM